MYLELARAFARAKTEVPRNQQLQSPNDLPAATQIHLQFVMNCGVVIFGISYLEAHVNRWLKLMIDGRLQIPEHNNLDIQTRDTFLQGLQKLQEEYQSSEERSRLFRNKSLKDKIKLLYRMLGATPLHDGKDSARQSLWQEFCDLENLRHELIHLKVEFIESKEFLKFVGLEREERERMAQIPAIVMGLLTIDLPVADVNISENVIISNITLGYADNSFLEGLLLGADYTEDEKRKWLSRRPHSFWNQSNTSDSNA